jgi:hypothetical protein
MPGDDWVRRCEKCDQNVYNLSALTRSEARRLLEERGGSVCTAFYRRTDGTLLTQQCPSSVRRLWTRMAAGAIGLGFALPAAPHPGGACPTSRATYQDEPCETTQLEVVVSDASGAVIPGAVVTLKQGDVETAGTSNEAGRVLRDKVTPGVYGLKVVCQGFRSFERNNLEIMQGRRHLVYVTMEVGSVGGYASYDPGLFDNTVRRSVGSLWRLVKQLWT